MIVHLTAKQLDATMKAFDEYDLGWINDRWLEESGVVRDRETIRECIMPAVGWLRAMSALVELTIGPLGGNRRDVKDSALAARRRIAAALHLYAAHPALFGVGLIGKHTDVFPAWVVPRAERPGRMYDIFPFEGHDFVHLIPEPDGQFTIWRGQHVLPISGGGRSLLEEAEHLRIIGRVAAATDQA